MSITLPAASSIPSRTTGVAPLAVFFDATATTGTETSYPFHELHYRWNFGDGSVGTWSTTGKSKNIAKGPIAAHVFETAGIFTWTLWVKDSTGTTETTSGQITVTSANTQFSGTNTICVSTGSDFSEAPSGSENHTTSSWATILGYIASGKRLLLKRGDTWSASSSGKSLSYTGPGIIGAFGTGAKPIFNLTGNDSVFEFSDGYLDWRIMDLDLNGPGSSSTNPAISDASASSNSNNLILRTDISGFITGYEGSWTGGTSREGIFIIDCSFDSIGASSGGRAMYIGGKKIVMMGNSVSQLVYGGIHSVRVYHAIKMLFQNCSIEYPGSDGHCLKFHNEIDLTPPDSQYSIISDNICKGGTVPIAVAPQSPGAYDERIKDAIIERNKLFTVDSTGDGIDLCCTYTTVRNNIIDSAGSSIYFVGINVFQRDGEPVPTRIFIYNNTGYKSDNGSEYELVKITSDVTNSVVRNNLAVTKNFTGYLETVLTNESGSTTASNNYLREGTGHLIDPDNENYHLASGSDMRDAGYTVPNFNDYDEYSRPANSVWDVGAFEYGGTTEDTELDKYGILW
jgi:hypothetical protein